MKYVDSLELGCIARVSDQALFSIDIDGDLEIHIEELYEGVGSVCLSQKSAEELYAWLGEALGKSPC